VFSVEGLRSGVQDLRMRTRIQRSGFEVWGLEVRVWDLGFNVWGVGFKVWGLGFRP